MSPPETPPKCNRDTAELPPGFRYSGVSCGIKPSGKPDLALIVADQPVVAAGVYTRNQVVAAPVVVSQRRTPSTSIRAVVTNSGNANACTGEQGMQDAIAMGDQVAELLGCSAQDVLIMSTGIIGKHLPMDCVQRGIDAAHRELAPTHDSFLDAAEAILTTDKDRKTVVHRMELGERSFQIAAMAKGAGMIAPNMATMLSVILTDAPLTPESAGVLLQRAADSSFNRVSVDGHTSTNDTLLLLSSGHSRGSGAPLEGQELETFQQELTTTAIELAKKLVADGEGASHVMAIRIHGAQDEASAEAIARSVAASPLVKTAVTGGDPNWGRIVSAAGNAPAQITPRKTTLEICGTTIFRDGCPIAYDESALSKKMKASAEVAIVLKVGDGPGAVEYWASDLTTDYVEFNSEYTT